MSITIIEDSKESEPEKQETQLIDVENIIAATATAVVDAVEATQENEAVDDIKEKQEKYFIELMAMVDSINNKVDAILSREIVETLEDFEETDEPQETPEPLEPVEPGEPEIVDGLANAIDNPAETILELTSKPKSTGEKTWI